MNSLHISAECIRPALYFLGVAAFFTPAAAEPLAIRDVWPHQARYTPGERVEIQIELNGSTEGDAGVKLDATFWAFGKQVGGGVSHELTLAEAAKGEATLVWKAPPGDYVGYMVDVRLTGADGLVLARGSTALDVSSDWRRFPRYGFLSYYSVADGVDAEAWIKELTKFHINGLQYYDFQYRHERPLAGSVTQPAPRWLDIAGRPVERAVLLDFLEQAKRRKMVSMAYNASYSAYSDAIDNGSVKLEWAVWDQPEGPRVASTIKNFELPSGGGWQTRGLRYMNQNDRAWQDYLFRQMSDLFAAYPFDGWHIDTFGAKGAYASNGDYVDYVQGFAPLINRAKQALGRPIVFNTVNTDGQEHVATSAAEFVYSELWDGHETYGSLWHTAERIRAVNSQTGIVFAAYHHRGYSGNAAEGTLVFNPTSVLLTNAAIFASGAAHIELGDEGRLLSSEYFPSRRFRVSAELKTALRRYYDFLTGYQNYLRDDIRSLPLDVKIEGQRTSPDGAPDAIWTLGQARENERILHLINLKGSPDGAWRDVRADRPDAPALSDLLVRVWVDRPVSKVWTASPDADAGRLQRLEFNGGDSAGRHFIEFRLPALKYWSMVVLELAN